MVVEKRKERRIKACLPIKISYDNLEINSKTENISRLGAYVEIDKEIPLGAQVSIGLDIPIYKKEGLSLSGMVRCRAAVFRSRLTKEIDSKKYYGIGIFFTDFYKPADRNKLSGYVDFLILQEEKGVKEDLKRWRKKRGMNKSAIDARKIKIEKNNYQAESVHLLKQVLERLEEIRGLLKTQRKDG